MLKLIATMAIILLGGVQGHARAEDESTGAFSKRYLAMASARQDDLKRYFTAVIPDCLPKTAMAHMKTQRVRDLTTLTFMKSATLTAEGRSPEAASRVLIPYLVTLGKQMSDDDQQSYLAVFRNGGLKADTQACVLSALKTSISSSDVGGTAEKWQLRR